MNRRSFFKSSLLAGIAAAVSPKLFAKPKPEVWFKRENIWLDCRISDETGFEYFVIVPDRNPIRFESHPAPETSSP